MTLNMYFPVDDTEKDDQRIIQAAVEQSIYFAELGYNPWYTDHHFRGPWHSNPLQFASYVAPLIPRDRYLGFGLLSIPFYHPLRLVESMNLLDQLTQGKVLYGLGSGWQGHEPAGLGVPPDYHASGQAAEDTLDVVERLWTFHTGDPAYEFTVGANSGKIDRRVTPSPFTLPHPIIIRAASRDASLARAGEKGWPAFLGIFNHDLHRTAGIYRRALAAANHPLEVVEMCMRWSCVDWLAVTVADTDEEALKSEAAAKAEQLDYRNRYIAQFGQTNGPVSKAKPGESTAKEYARGGDMRESIVGSPDTVAACIGELVDAGINHVHLRFLGEWLGETGDICKTSAELFAKEVMPRFAHAQPLTDPLALEV
jgi:alkanesulfonate monooxygenase SsuD/methylene tetrahydromethanopterin reductase-like flavin-dependent oxidoreductase (luciferase family)